MQETRKAHKVSYGSYQSPGFGREDIGREFLFPDGKKAVIAATEFGKPINGYLIGCSCSNGKCYTSIFPISWESFMDVTHSNSKETSNKCWLVLVTVDDPRTVSKVLTRRDLVNRPGVVFKYLAKGDGTLETSQARYVPDEKGDAHPEMPERMDMKFIGVSDSKAKDTYARPVVVCWDPVTKWEPEHAPVVIEPLLVLIDGITAEECLIRYEKLMQTCDSAIHDAGTVRRIRSGSNISDPITLEPLFTPKQHAAAKVEWSRALKAKGAAAAEADRLQVTCEDQYEL